MTDTQLELVKVKPVALPPRPLTDRQATALEHLQAAGHAGLTGAGLGKLIHSHDWCVNCHRDGLPLLKALKKKGWARQTTGSVYIALELPTPKRDPDDIPF